jgi:hypothetical protein
MAREVVIYCKWTCDGQCGNTKLSHSHCDIPPSEWKIVLAHLNMGEVGYDQRLDLCPACAHAEKEAIKKYSNSIGH